MTALASNTLYKNITTSNSSEMLRRISAELDGVLNYPYQRSCRKSYHVPSHYKPFDQTAYEKAKRETPFRGEEWMCKLCMGKTFQSVGTIVDYQVPLKHSMKCAGMGKIDILSKDKDTAWLLELKVPGSTEAPLRAIMEIFTYWKQLGGDDCAYFLERSAANGAVRLKKGIVLFREYETKQSRIYAKLEKDADALSDLMQKLDVSCFLASLDPDDPEHMRIAGMEEWR